MQLQSLHNPTGSESESDVSSGGGGGGGGTSYKAKLAFSPTDTDQLVGHAMVASFIHSNKHPDQNALAPALGISNGIGAEVKAILYDCREDVMLHISPLLWIDFSSKRFVEDGILVLWLLLHHRPFLKNLAQCDTLPKARVVEIFDQSHSLTRYQSLVEFKICEWSGRSSLQQPRARRLALRESVPSKEPPQKKSKS